MADTLVETDLNGWHGLCLKHGAGVDLQAVRNGFPAHLRFGWKVTGAQPGSPFMLESRSFVRVSPHLLAWHLGCS